MGDEETKTERVGDPPSIGKDVIPMLLKKGVAVYIIGRHHLQYRPVVGPHKLLRLLPQDPGPVFAYPPDPSSNDFVKYRIQRLLDPSVDPLMTDEEKATWLTSPPAVSPERPRAGQDRRQGGERRRVGPRRPPALVLPPVRSLG